METTQRAQLERCLGILGDMLDREIRRGRDPDSARFLYGQVTGALALGRTLGIIDEEEEVLRFQEAQKKFYDAF